MANTATVYRAMHFDYLVDSHVLSNVSPGPVRVPHLLPIGSETAVCGKSAPFVQRPIIADDDTKICQACGKKAPSRPMPTHEELVKVPGLSRGLTTNDQESDMPKSDDTDSQITANIERIRTLSVAGESDAAAALYTETEALISSVVKANGKADTESRRKYRAAASEARKAQPPVTPSSEVATVTPADPAITDDYHTIPKAVELVSMGADKVREGITAGLKASNTAREVANIMMDLRLSQHTKAGLPDLKCTRQATKDSHADIYATAMAGMDIDPGQRELVFKSLQRAVNYQMSDVVVRWVEALDNSHEAYAELFPSLVTKYPDLSPAGAVRKHYGISDKSEIDKAREREQRKAELAAKAKELEAAGGAPDSEGDGGDGGSDDGHERTPRLFANLNAMKEANEKAAENVKAVRDDAHKAEAREQIQARMSELATLLAALS